MGIQLTQVTPTGSSRTDSERHICTGDRPWKPGMGRAVHPDARETGAQRMGGRKETCRPMSAHIAALDSRWNYRNDTRDSGDWSQLNTHLV